MLGGAFFVASVAGTLTLPGLWTDVQAHAKRLRERLGRYGLPAWVVVCAAGVYVGIPLLIVIVAFVANTISDILLFVASTVSAVAALLLWISGSFLLLLAALLRPVELWHALRTLRDVVGRLAGSKK
jgi:hypothetical protein